MGTPHSGGQSFQLSLFCTFGYGTHELKSGTLSLSRTSLMKMLSMQAQNIWVTCQRRRKNLRKFSDGHQKFVQKSIEEAKGLITESNHIKVKMLKFLRTTVETKYLVPLSLDCKIVDLVDDIKVIDIKVSESCELMRTRK